MNNSEKDSKAASTFSQKFEKIDGASMPQDLRNLLFADNKHLANQLATERDCVASSSRDEDVEINR